MLRSNDVCKIYGMFDRVPSFLDTADPNLKANKNKELLRF